MRKYYSFLSLLFLSILLLPSARSQTITTTYTNNNGFACITFNFRNNNAFPIKITEIGSVCGTSAITTSEAWFNTTAVNTTTQPTINGANGWTVFGTGSVTGVANTTTTTAQMLMTGLNFVVPPSTTYGIALNISNYSTGSLRYSSLAAGTYTESAGGCDILTGTNIGWAGGAAPGPLANNNRGFIGYVTFGPAVATAPGCLLAPVAPINNSTTICSGTTMLRWNKAATATGYDVVLNAGTGAPTTVVSTNQVDTFYAATTTPGPYRWRIVPRNAAGSATGCTNWAFTTIPSLTPSVTHAVSPNDTICAYTATSFTAISVNGGSSPGYQWKKNNINVGTNNPIYVDAGLVDGDQVKVVMTSNAVGCLSDPSVTSNTTTMKVISAPSTTITAAGPVAFCNGGSVVLNGQPGGTNYQWMQDGIDIAGATTPSFSATYQGYYKLRSNTTANACPSTSDSILVTVYATPFPLVNRSGMILSTELSYDTYQWYYDGVAIPGATASTYTITRDGIYSVKVTDTHGCQGTSIITPINSLGIANYSGTPVSIYPNPANTVINVSSSVAVNVVIRSMDGKIVIQQKNASVLNIAALSDGIYMISVTDQDNQLMRIERLVKASK